MASYSRRSLLQPTSLYTWDSSPKLLGWTWCFNQTMDCFFCLPPLASLSTCSKIHKASSSFSLTTSYQSHRHLLLLLSQLVPCNSFSDSIPTHLTDQGANEIVLFSVRSQHTIASYLRSTKWLTAGRNASQWRACDLRRQALERRVLGIAQRLTRLEEAEMEDDELWKGFRRSPY